MRALIATDGSPASLDAARRARAVLRDDAELVLVTVLPQHEEYAAGIDGAPLSSAKAEDVLVGEAAEAATVLAATAEALAPATVDRRVAYGSAGEAICELARELDVDVVVVGRHGHTGLARLLGSVSGHVVHHCDRPVLVVEPTGR